VPPRLTLLASALSSTARDAFPLDIGLDANARQAATALQGTFGNNLRVLSSPARRAVETADVLGPPVAIEPALRDLDMGRWAGSPLRTIAASEPDAAELWLKDPAAAPHGGESLEALHARAGAWLEDVAQSGGALLAVTHPAFMRAAIVSALAATPLSFWHIDIAPLSRVELTSNGRRWTLKELTQPQPPESPRNSR
jgi:broad specificity phosphatase PhoE